MLGILLIDKPRGITSHDVVDAVRRMLGTRRVGHAGTLDPLATGLLVVAVGPATRFLQYLPLEPKEYVADIAFGRSTDSYDAEGETVQETPPPADLRERVLEAIPQFFGLISQIPPMHSAIKLGGKPLYRYARAGETVEREARKVHIGTFELENLHGSLARMRIVCSGGTYVRTLAHDLGAAVGCGAYLAGLSRTAVGRFSLTQSIALGAVTAKSLMPLREALPPMPLVELNAQQTAHVREGRMIPLANTVQARHVALMGPDGDVFSVARVHGDFIQPECVIPGEASRDAV